MNTTVTLIIITAWGVTATVAMIAALRARTKLRLLLVRTGNELITTKAHLARAQEELRRATTRTVPVRDDSDGKLSMARALRRITGPVKPTSARTSSTSRNDSTDAMMMGSLIAPGGWSAPATDTSTSCDTSSSSSSSDGGSCGGGE